MTPEDLARTIAREHIDAQLITDIGDTSTVSAAAAALGVEAERILKTLLFLVRGEPVVVISHGVAPVPVRALADYFGVGKRQIKLAHPQQVWDETGFPAGGAPPVGHRVSHPVLMAQSILDYDVMFGGGGDDRTMLRIPVSELMRVLQPVLLPLK